MQGLDRFRPLVNLTHLELAHTPINGSRLSALKPLAQLRFLTLEDTAVDDRAARQLGELVAAHRSSVWIIPASPTPVCPTWPSWSISKRFGSAARHISDAGLAKLAALKQLRSLHLEETDVTDAGVAALGQLLPEVDITR